MNYIIVYRKKNVVSIQREKDGRVGGGIKK
jgi:hypothetical protein